MNNKLLYSKEKETKANARKTKLKTSNHCCKRVKRVHLDVFTVINCKRVGNHHY